jgi:hypothetical protein
MAPKQTPLWHSYDVPPKYYGVVRPEGDDLECPACGARVVWQCYGETGSAFCILSGWASLSRNDCQWRGSVRRIPGGLVELVPEESDNTPTPE